MNLKSWLKIFVVKKTDLFKIFGIWAFYSLLVNCYMLVLDKFGQVDVREHTIKEVCFALWGWGWDGMHYLKIATQGYEYPLQAFFPGYPLLIKFADIFLPFTLAYRINAVLLLPVLIGLFYLMDYFDSYNSAAGIVPTKEVSSINKLQALLLLVMFPTGFFLQSNYTETPFILVSLVGLFLLIKKKYFLAAVAAGILTSIKISGIALSAVIVLFFILDKTNRFKQIPQNFLFFIGKLFVIASISCVGFLGYMFYLNQNYGSYQVFFNAQSKWGREFIHQKNTPVEFFTGFITPVFKSIKNQDNSIFRRFSEIGAVVIGIYTLFRFRKNLPLPIYLYSLMQFLIPLTSGTFLSMNRQILLAYPLLLSLFLLISKNKILYTAFLIVFTVLQGIGIYLFFNNIFIG